MFFICSRIPFRTPHYNSLSCLLRLLLTVTVPQTSLVSDNIDIFKRYWSGIFILQDVLLLGFDFFLVIRLVYGFGGGISQR